MVEDIMVKKGAALLVSLVVLAAVGCGPRVKFVKTGNVYPALALDANVDVIMRAVPDYKVEQIGIITVEGGDIETQIENVKKVAREKGGNVVVLTEVKQGVMTNKNVSTGGTDVMVYDIRTFEIAKKVETK
jgi:hypothetical protein